MKKQAPNGKYSEINDGYMDWQKYLINLEEEKKLDPIKYSDRLDRILTKVFLASEVSGLSQKEIADKIGINRSYYSKFQNKHLKHNGVNKLIDVFFKPLSALYKTDWSEFDSASKGQEKDLEVFKVKIITNYHGLAQKSPVAQKNNSSDVKIKNNFYIPFFRPHLEGRNIDLSNLHESLKHSNTAITGAAALTGQGGIGKTQLAIEYAYRYKNEYKALFWLPAQDTESFIQAMGTYAFDLNLIEVSRDTHQQSARNFYSWLAKNPDTLLIIDDIQDPKFLVKDIPGLFQCKLGMLSCTVLATTRLAEPVGVLPFPLELLSVDDSRRLLIGDAGVQDSPDVEIIARLLGGLPLAIKIASGFLKFSKANPSELVEILREAGIENVESQTDDQYLPFDYNRPVKALLEESYQTLTGKHAQYAKRLLQILALLPVNRIHSSEIIEKVLPIPSFSGNKNILFQSSVTLLKDRNILEVTEHNGLRLHPIIHDLLQSKITDRLGEEVSEQAAYQFRKINYLRTLGLKQFLRLSQNIPAFLPFAKPSTELRLRNLSKLIDIQFHTIQMGGDPIAQLQLQAMKIGDDVFAKDCECYLQDHHIPRLRLNWTTSENTQALMRILVPMSNNIFGYGMDNKSNLICSLIATDEDFDFPTIKLWRVAGNDPENPFLDREYQFQNCTLSGSGKIIICIDSSGYVKGFDAETGVEMYSLQFIDTDEFYKIDFWGDSEIYSNVSGDRCLIITVCKAWFIDFEMQKVLHSWSIPKNTDITIHGCLSADGKFAILHDGKQMTMADADCKTNFKNLKIEKIKDIRLSQDGKKAVTLCSNDLVFIDITSNFSIIQKVDVGSIGYPFCFSIDLAADNALVGYTNGYMVLYSIESEKPIKYTVEPGGHVKTCLLGIDSKYCLSESLDRSLRLWDISEFTDFGLFKDKGTPQMICAFRENDDKEELVTLDLSGKVNIWDIDQGVRLKKSTVQLTQKDAIAGSITSDGNWVCAIGENDRLYAINNQTGTRRELDLPQPEFNFSSDEYYNELIKGGGNSNGVIDQSDLYIVSCQASWVAVMNGPKNIFIAHLDHPEIKYMLNFEDDISDLEVSPCGEYLAVLLQEKVEIYSLSFEQPQLIHKLELDNSIFQKVCIAPKGKTIALGHAGSSKVSIKGVEDQSENSYEFTVETLPIEFSQNGESLLMMEGDNRVIIFTSNEEWAPKLDLFVGNVRFMRWNQGSDRLAALGHDGSIYLFDVMA